MSEDKGNYLGEWFGFRVWPPEDVDDSEAARHHQTQRLCPFISLTTRQETVCVKSKQTGVCTISSDSNQLREDWLACPFRVMDDNFYLLEEAIRTVYGVDRSEPIALFPIPILNKPERRLEIMDDLRNKVARTFLFTANKLGGEVDIPETEASPGGKVDFSVVEATLGDPRSPIPLLFGKVMMFEVQTADFHGSPIHATSFLEATCHDQMAQPYHDVIRQHPERVGNRVEGPNKANVFKRTIYQMLYKMELSRDVSCAGFVIVLPLPVWTSWLRHLGKPNLEVDGNNPGFLTLKRPNQGTNPDDLEEQDIVQAEPAWIFVFDIDRASSQSPKPLEIIHRITTNSASLMHFAFEAAAERSVSAGALTRYRQIFVDRIGLYWKVNPQEDLVAEQLFSFDDAEEV